MITFSQLSNSYVYDRGYCHNRVNQIAQQSTLNLTSVIQEKQSMTISLPKIKNSFTQNQNQNQKTQMHGKKLPAFTMRVHTNPQFDQKESEKIDKNVILTKRIKQLKTMQLMEKNRLQLMKFENQNKRSSIMNDFHSPKTNGGFSRSKTGGIYYK